MAPDVLLSFWCFLARLFVVIFIFFLTSLLSKVGGQQSSIFFFFFCFCLIKYDRSPPTFFFLVFFCFRTARDEEISMLASSLQRANSGLEEKEARLQQALEETRVAESRLEQVRDTILLCQPRARVCIYLTIQCSSAERPLLRAPLFGMLS